MESWLKNLIEYKYVEQNMNRARDIGVQSWPFRSQEIARFSPKIWLWRQVPENWQVTMGFILWLFLSWSIDYRTKNPKIWFGRMTSWTFGHPISHCAFRYSHPWNAIFFWREIWIFFCRHEFEKIKDDYNENFAEILEKYISSRK